MERAQLKELHYLTTIDNVPSILELGLLSHRRAEDVEHRSVAMEEIQERRAAVIVPNGRRLHEYVNLYINCRNATMFKVVHKHPVDELCVIRVSCGVLDLSGVVITDYNAATDYVRFRDANGLEQIDQEEVFARYWTHPGDPQTERRHKARMCAEVLVPDRVGPEFFLGAYVGSRSARDAFVRVTYGGIAVMIDGYKFFCGEEVNS
jgi:hypothetical protein